MIEGLKVRILGSELIEMCRRRADELRAISKGVGEAPIFSMAASGFYGLMADMKTRAERNKRQDEYLIKAQTLEAFGFRVNPAEEYLLAPEELDRFYQQPSTWNPHPVNFAPDAAFPPIGEETVQ